jgi:hypothetical protein
MTKAQPHYESEVPRSGVSPWGTWTKNDYFGDTHTEIYPTAKKWEIAHLPHGAKQKRTEAANLRRLQLIKESDNLKQDWLDAGYWRLLARLRNFRLADYYQPLTTRGIHRTLSKLSLTSSEFREYFGDVTYERYVELNVSLPLWAFQGIVLEHLGKP